MDGFEPMLNHLVTEHEISKRKATFLAKNGSRESSTPHYFLQWIIGEYSDFLLKNITGAFFMQLSDTPIRRIVFGCSLQVQNWHLDLNTIATYYSTVWRMLGA